MTINLNEMTVRDNKGVTRQYKTKHAFGNALWGVSLDMQARWLKGKEVKNDLNSYKDGGC